jgi:hypothetical protein
MDDIEKALMTLLSKRQRIAVVVITACGPSRIQAVRHIMNMGLDRMRDPFGLQRVTKPVLPKEWQKKEPADG